MPRPLIPAEDVYARALELLDSQGRGALQARKLAADLKISTRTLYQQVGSQQELIRALVAQHFSQLSIDFHRYDDFDTTATRWCEQLYDTLREHPHLTELMQIDDRVAVEEYVVELIRAARAEGYPRELAVECCRSLLNVTINHTIIEIRALREPEFSPGTAEEIDKVSQSFKRTIRWVLAGVRDDLRNQA